MLNGRKILTATLIALAACMQGCLISWPLASSTAVVTGTTGAYVATSEPATECLTNLSSVGPVVNVTDAVREWLNRGELPLPVLGDGVHTFHLKAGDFTGVKGARGARIVQLLDGEVVIAEYTVAWDRVPPEYRLAAARNLLYEGELDVGRVPILKTYEID